MECGVGLRLVSVYILLGNGSSLWGEPVHFRGAFVVSATSNFAAWSECSKLDIFEITHERSTGTFRHLRFKLRTTYRSSGQMRGKMFTKTNLNVTLQIQTPPPSDRPAAGSGRPRRLLFASGGKKSLFFPSRDKVHSAVLKGVRNF